MYWWTLKNFMLKICFIKTVILNNSILINAFIKFPALRIWNLCKRGARKIVRLRWKMSSRDQGLPDITGLIHTGTKGTMTVYTKPTQIQARRNPSSEKWKWAQSPPSNIEALCNWYLLGWEIELSPISSITGNVKHISNLAPCPGRVGQHKIDLVSFCAFIVLFLQFCLVGFLLVFFFVVTNFWKTERKTIKRELGRDFSIIWEEL